jgi:hypothetical protein
MRFLKLYNGVSLAHQAVILLVLLITLAANVLGIINAVCAGALCLSNLVICIIVLALVHFQAVYGFFSPPIDAGNRRTFNVVHMWSGRAMIVLAVVNSFIGLELAGVGVGWIILVASVVFLRLTAISIFSRVLKERFPTSMDSQRAKLRAHDLKSHYHTH